MLSTFVIKLMHYLTSIVDAKMKKIYRLQTMEHLDVYAMLSEHYAVGFDLPNNSTMSTIYHSNDN